MFLSIDGASQGRLSLTLLAGGQSVETLGEVIHFTFKAFTGLTRLYVLAADLGFWERCQSVGC